MAEITPEEEARIIALVETHWNELGKSPIDISEELSKDIVNKLNSQQGKEFAINLPRGHKVAEPIPIKGPKVIRIFSDLHIGNAIWYSKNQHEKLLQAFDSIIQENGKSILIFNGDVFETWQKPEKNGFPAKTKVLLEKSERIKEIKQKLIEMKAKGMTLYYLNGNHDDDVKKEYIEQYFGDILQVPSKAAISINDEIIITHGHNEELFNSLEPIQYINEKVTELDVLEKKILERPIGYYIARLYQIAVQKIKNLKKAAQKLLKQNSSKEENEEEEQEDYFKNDENEKLSSSVDETLEEELDVSSGNFEELAVELEIANNTSIISYLLDKIGSIFTFTGIRRFLDFVINKVKSGFEKLLKGMINALVCVLKFSFDYKLKMEDGTSIGLRKIFDTLITQYMYWFANCQRFSLTSMILSAKGNYEPWFQHLPPETRVLIFGHTHQFVIKEVDRLAHHKFTQAKNFIVNCGCWGIPKDISIKKSNYPMSFGHIQLNENNSFTITIRDENGQVMQKKDVHASDEKIEEATTGLQKSTSRYIQTIHSNEK